MVTTLYNQKLYAEYELHFTSVTKLLGSITAIALFSGLQGHFLTAFGQG
jgi:hypothetical protein